jgi:hypothetical protein
VQIVTAGSWTPGRPAPVDEPAADRFLRLACLTSSDNDVADRSAATRLLAEQPDLPAESLLVAAACADVAAIRRHLANRRSAATETGGPHGWSPLLHQAYARHDPGVDLAATLDTARLLLDAGADPNDGRFWHALPTPFTVLTGVLGYGAPNAVELLIAAGFDVNARGRSDMLSNMPWHTALHAAAANGDLPLARTLWTWAPTRTSPTSTTSPPHWAGPATSTSQP